ncbi:hypothetical protein QYM36_016393 [Artemia franciscana]|uniref:Methyltransferase domain-containing protein n=2 Tax=Artemia franciscana TaxID=6661 RepID=A0AA88HK44_ARTSF|nr:hypothetical protein QYM36_016393 [Artemia franciscana]
MKDIARWHAWNNFGACRNLKFFGGRVWKEWLFPDVCLDENIRPVSGNCLVYSFGVKDNWSFEDALMEYGCEVHGFDPTIEEPEQTGERRFIFHKIGLQAKDKVNTKGWHMKSLRSIMTLLGHGNRIIDVIKMDIEQSEYEAAPNMIDSGVTAQIKQIALETHNFQMSRQDSQNYRFKYQQIYKLEKHGFIRFSSQAGMGSDRLNEIANISDFFIYEMAWYNPKFYFV